jgi:hypothetical protein
VPAAIVFESLELIAEVLTQKPFFNDIASFLAVVLVQKFEN